MNTRVDWVDYAKAIGIIMVVYGHVARGVYNSGIEFSEYFFTLTDNIIYSFHMPLFFFLSGLFFYQSFVKKGARQLFFSKIDTIVYPYLVWSILQGSMEVFLASYTNGNVTLSEVFSLWEPRAQFWFLYALFLIFLVSIVVYFWIPKKLEIIVIILAGILYIEHSMVSGIPILGVVSNNLVFFMLGVFFTKYNIQYYLSSLVAFFVILMTFVIAQYLFHISLAEIYTYQGVESLLLACVSIAFVVSLSILVSKSSMRFLAVIGASSMAIYLMHILAGSGIRVILSKLFGIDSLAVHLIVGCFAGVLLPLLAIKIIGAIKIPYVFTAPVCRWVEYLFKRVASSVGGR